MMGKRFTDEQITYALRQANSGSPVADVCRQMGMSEASYCVWKKKHGKLGLTELRELRALRDKDARLKRLVANLSLDKHIRGEVVRKRALRPARRRALARWIHERFQTSVRRACRLAEISQTSWSAKSTARD